MFAFYLVDLVDYCNRQGKKYVHISTDIVYAGSVHSASEDDVPIHARNWYAYSKLLADGYVQAVCEDYLLIRTAFKPRPFPHKVAVNKVGNFDYVDVITGLIVELIEGEASGVYNVGTKLKTMLEHAREIRIGTEIIRTVLGAKTVRIAIEDNKPDAIEAMQQAYADMPGDVSVTVLRTSYPQGSEKQQIYSVTGREVPRGGLPMDVGCVVENVSTAFAIYDAVMNGRPLVKRVITVTGDAIAKPANLLAPVGTLYRDLVAACGITSEQPVKIISGGPMMGFTVASLDIPTGKTASGLLLLTAKRVSTYTSQACISCGRCVEACPMRLAPSELSQFIEADDIEGAEQNALMDCIECGSCAFVCPAHRPLVHHMRRGKAAVMAKRAAARKNS